jgi:putative transposase
MRRCRKKHISLHRGMPPPASSPNERWSMDFIHNQLSNGLAFRALTVVDNWSCESMLLETGFRLASRVAIMTLDQAAQSRKLPTSPAVDHGAEFTSLVIGDWAHVNSMSLAFTRLGKPTDNGLCESFNSRHRDDFLNVHEFKSMAEAKRIIEAWRCDCNKKKGGTYKLTWKSNPK